MATNQDHQICHSGNFQDHQDRRDQDRFDLWDDAWPAPTELQFALERVSQDRAAPLATAACQIALAGFSRQETWRQLEAYFRDEIIDIARELLEAIHSAA